MLGQPATRSGSAAQRMSAALLLCLGVCLAPPASADAFATLSAVVAVPLAAARPAETPKADPELVRLRDFVVGSDRSLATRRDAAEVLLDKDTPAARAILVEALAGPAPSEPVLAVLEAIAGRESAHAAFVEPLMTLLKSDDEPTRLAAAAAFAPYQGNDKVRTRLTDLPVRPMRPWRSAWRPLGPSGALWTSHPLKRWCI